MKIKKYTNGAWTDLDKPVKKYDTYTDEATSLPLTIETSKTDAVENYQIYGASGGVGEETENLAPPISEWVDGYINGEGGISPPMHGAYEKTSEFINVQPNTLYTYSIIGGFPYKETNPSWRGVAYYNIYQNFISRSSGYSAESISEKTPVNAFYVRLTYRTYGQTNSPMYILGSTAPTTYIPFGYKIPILLESGNLWNGEIEQGAVNTQGYIVDSNERVRSCITGLISGHRYTIQSNICLRMIYAYNGGWNGTKISNVLDTSRQTYEYTFILPDGANSIGVALYVWSSNITVPSDVTTAILIDQSNYDLFVGDSKLYEDEYLDFVEQKIYKTIALTTYDDKTFTTSDNNRFCVRRSNNG